MHRCWENIWKRIFNEKQMTNPRSFCTFFHLVLGFSDWLVSAKIKNTTSDGRYYFALWTRHIQQYGLWVKATILLYSKQAPISSNIRDWAMTSLQSRPSRKWYIFMYLGELLVDFNFLHSLCFRCILNFVC